MTRLRDEGAPRSERGLERLVNFSDAVVAIAITLIVLPLVDAAAERGADASRFLTENGPRLGAAALSFAIVGLFWRDHHQELERADRHTGPLVALDLVWLASIVFLPVPTSLLFASTSGRRDLLGAAMYIGTMLCSMLAMRGMQIEIARHAAADGVAPRTRRDLVLGWVPVALMGIALVGALAGSGTSALYVLLLAVPVSVAQRGLRHRRRTGPARPRPRPRTLR